MTDDLRAQRLHELAECIEVQALQRLGSAELGRDVARLLRAEVDHMALHVMNAADDVVRRDLFAKSAHARDPVFGWQPLGLEADEQLQSVADALAQRAGMPGVVVERVDQPARTEVFFAGEQIVGPVARAMLGQTVVCEASLDRALHDRVELALRMPTELTAVATVITEPGHRSRR